MPRPRIWNHDMFVEAASMYLIPYDVIGARKTAALARRYEAFRIA
jgi:hypothetical protein